MPIFHAIDYMLVFNSNMNTYLSLANITLDPRFPDSVGGIFPGPATTQKVYQGIEGFSLAGGVQ